ncbi:MAG: restriction endonuclease subunit S [Bacteroidaceae bacterium]|nr:restriction endonuclease subunit S [Bacteroidaceae bacterium]
MEYKRLGDYIREVNVRNRDLKVTKLVGLTIDKAFIPSVANVIGTDLSNYKVIQKEQFACSLMQVSRDGKMPVAMFKEDEAIMSPAYPMFEVIDKTVLMPQYLMMWFSRSEFDREASYYAVGGVRGSLTWEDFCNMRLPIPSITRQREIVSEYETLANRIRLNNQMIQYLEATAQALYRKTFVDNIDKENLPEGWRMGTIGELANIKAGGDKPHDFSEVQTEEYNVPVYANGIDNKGLFGFTTKPVITTKSITISARGTIGYCFLRKRPFVPIVRLIVVIPHDEDVTQYLFYYLNYSNIKGSGSVQSQLTVPDMESKNIIIPPVPLIQEFNKQVEIIDNSISFCEKENEKLIELQSLLLAKMGQ